MHVLLRTIVPALAVWLLLSQGADPAPSTVPPPPNEVLSGGSDYVLRTFSEPYSIEATTVSLPPRPKNASWYGIWLMLIPLGRVERAPFLQVGAMRWALHDYRTSAFMATQHRGADLRYDDLPRFGIDKPAYRVRMAASGGRIEAWVDGVRVFSGKTRDWFDPGDVLYVQLGTQVSALGDAASGEIRDVRFSNDAVRTPVAILASCGVAVRGVSLALRDGRFVAQGTASERQPTRYLDLASGRTLPHC
jgi:hypothetical protein